jgi:hypothetical protein
MHTGLSAEASQLVNAKLILLLANQVGDLDILREAMALARQDVVRKTDDANQAMPNKET